LVNLLRAALGALGINGEQLLLIMDLLAPEEREFASPVQQLTRQGTVGPYGHTKTQIQPLSAMTVLELVRVIEDWHPHPFKSEREYQTSLYDHIKKHLPEGSTVQKNYPHAGMVVDLYVRLQAIGGVFEVFLELKRKFTNPECNRLIGQIRQIGLKQNIVVVLVGNVPPAFVGRLKEEFAAYLSRGVAWGQTSMFIVEKSVESKQ